MWCIDVSDANNREMGTFNQHLDYKEMKLLEEEIILNDIMMTSDVSYLLTSPLLFDYQFYTQYEVLSSLSVSGTENIC